MSKSKRPRPFAIADPFAWSGQWLPPLPLPTPARLNEADVRVCRTTFATLRPHCVRIMRCHEAERNEVRKYASWLVTPAGKSGATYDHGHKGPLREVPFDAIVHQLRSKLVESLSTLLALLRQRKLPPLGLRGCVDYALAPLVEILTESNARGGSGRGSADGDAVAGSAITGGGSGGGRLGRDMASSDPRTDRRVVEMATTCLCELLSQLNCNPLRGKLAVPELVAKYAWPECRPDFSSASYLHGDAFRFFNVFHCVVGSLTDSDTGSLRAESQLTEETAEAAVDALLALLGDGVVAAAAIAGASKAGEFVLGFSLLAEGRPSNGVDGREVQGAMVAPAIEQLRSPTRRVAVGHCISLLLDLIARSGVGVGTDAKGGYSFALGTRAIEALWLLCLASDGDGAIGSGMGQDRLPKTSTDMAAGLNAMHSTLACFYPGIASALAKVVVRCCQVGHRGGSKMTAAAIELLAGVTMLTLDDARVDDQSLNYQHRTSGGNDDVARGHLVDIRGGSGESGGRRSGDGRGINDTANNVLLAIAQAAGASAHQTVRAKAKACQLPSSAEGNSSLQKKPISAPLAWALSTAHKLQTVLGETISDQLDSSLAVMAAAKNNTRLESQDQSATLQQVAATAAGARPPRVLVLIRAHPHWRVRLAGVNLSRCAMLAAPRSFRRLLPSLAELVVVLSHDESSVVSRAAREALHEFRHSSRTRVETLNFLQDPRLGILSWEVFVDSIAARLVAAVISLPRIAHASRSRGSSSLVLGPTIPSSAFSSAATGLGVERELCDVLQVVAGYSVLLGGGGEHSRLQGIFDAASGREGFRLLSCICRILEPDTHGTLVLQQGVGVGDGGGSRRGYYRTRFLHLRSGSTMRAMRLVLHSWGRGLQPSFLQSFYQRYPSAAAAFLLNEALLGAGEDGSRGGAFAMGDAEATAALTGSAMGSAKGTGGNRRLSPSDARRIVDDCVLAPAWSAPTVPARGREMARAQLALNSIHTALLVRRIGACAEALRIEWRVSKSSHSGSGARAFGDSLLVRCIYPLVEKLGTGEGAIVRQAAAATLERIAYARGFRPQDQEKESCKRKPLAWLFASSADYIVDGIASRLARYRWGASAYDDFADEERQSALLSLPSVITEFVGRAPATSATALLRDVVSALVKAMAATIAASHRSERPAVSIMGMGFVRADGGSGPGGVGGGGSGSSGGAQAESTRAELSTRFLAVGESVLRAMERIIAEGVRGEEKESGFDRASNVCSEGDDEDIENDDDGGGGCGGGGGDDLISWLVLDMESYVGAIQSLGGLEKGAEEFEPLGVTKTNIDQIKDYFATQRKKKTKKVAAECKEVEDERKTKVLPADVRLALGICKRLLLQSGHFARSPAPSARLAAQKCFAAGIAAMAASKSSEDLLPIVADTWPAVLASLRGEGGLEGANLYIVDDIGEPEQEDVRNVPISLNSVASDLGARPRAEALLAEQRRRRNAYDIRFENRDVAAAKALAEKEGGEGDRSLSTVSRAIAVAACGTLQVIVRCAGSFMTGRFESDVWPVLRRELRAASRSGCVLGREPELVRACKEAAAADYGAENDAYKLHPRLAYEKTSLRHKHVVGIFKMLADVVEVERGALVMGIVADVLAVVGPYLSDKVHPELRHLAVDLFKVVAKHGDGDAVWLKAAEIGGTLGCGAMIGKEGKPCVIDAAALQPAHAMFDLVDASAGAPPTVAPRDEGISFVGNSNDGKTRIRFAIDAEALHASWEQEHMRLYCKDNDCARSSVEVLKAVLA